jgi:surface antigen
MGGVVGGGAIGGMIGPRIGAALDDEDKRRAYAAQVQALEGGPSGAPVAWRNPDSGRYGSIVPGPAYQANGANCRQFTHTIYIDAKPQTARGAACRNADGTWVAG